MRNGQFVLAHDDLTAKSAAGLRLPGTFGYVAEFHDSIGSTNDRACDLALQGAPEGCVVVADHQSAGRGRLGRSWQAPPRTCVMLSIVLRPEVERLGWLSPLAALAVLDTIDPHVPGAATCKWPNDVLLGGRKTCGILVETVFAGTELRAVVLGIGLNVNLDPTGLTGVTGPPTSLAAFTGRRYSRFALLDALVAALEREAAQLHAGVSPIPRWARRLDTIGRRVSVAGAGTVLSGVAEAVDDTGSLLLRLDDGLVRVVSAGEVTLAAGMIGG